MKKRTKDSLEKLSALSSAGRMALIGAPIGAFVGYNMEAEDDEKRMSNTVAGAGVGGVWGYAAGKQHTRSKNSFGGGDGPFGGKDPFGGRGPGGGGGSRGFRPRGKSTEEAAKDIGLKYKGGKFYDADGNPLSKKKDVKRAYRRTAMKHHPDRGGSEDAFKKVNNSFNDVIKNSKDFEKLSFFLKKYASKKEKRNSKWALGTAGFLGGMGADIGYNAIKKKRAIKGGPMIYAGAGGFAGGAVYDWVKNRGKDGKG